MAGTRESVVIGEMRMPSTFCANEGLDRGHLLVGGVLGVDEQELDAQLGGRGISFGLHRDEEGEL
jgi:hypothetical protein